MGPATDALDGWFARLPASDRDALHALGAPRRYKPGSILFHEGDPSDWVVLLTAGRVKVSATTADGKEVVLAVSSSGEVLGELSAIDAGPRSATTVAIDPVEARIVAGDDFRAFLERHPRASLLLLRSVTARLRVSDRRRVEFVALDSVGRVAAQIAELADRFGSRTADGEMCLNIPLSQTELAGMTGASREAVGKALQLFRRRGWIATGRRSITVVDLEAIRSRGL